LLSLLTFYLLALSKCVVSTVFTFLFVTAWRECSCSLLEKHRASCKWQGRLQGVNLNKRTYSCYLVLDFRIRGRVFFLFCWFKFFFQLFKKLFLSYCSWVF
jgi:hypothetical protein